MSHAFKLIAAISLAVLSTGCSTRLQEKENLAFVAGFTVVAPVKPDQQAILAKLPAGKITQTAYRGKIYFVLPDARYGQAYVGDPKEYQAYRELCRENKLSNEAAEMNDAAAMDWSAWGDSANAGGFRR